MQILDTRGPVPTLPYVECRSLATLLISVLLVNDNLIISKMKNSKII